LLPVPLSCSRGSGQQEGQSIVELLEKRQAELAKRDAQAVQEQQTKIEEPEPTVIDVSLDDGMDRTGPAGHQDACVQRPAPILGSAIHDPVEAKGRQEFGI
jgi:hypothetical protein